MTPAANRKKLWATAAQHDGSSRNRPKGTDDVDNPDRIGRVTQIDHGEWRQPVRANGVEIPIARAPSA